MIRKTIAGLTAAAAIAGSLALAAPAQADAFEGDPYDFDIVNTAITATGIDLPSTFTAFFPNDRAFEVLANNLGLLGPTYKYGAKVDEAKIVEALVRGVGDDQAGDLTLDQVEAVLAYHVVPNAYLPGAAVVAGSRYKELKMANGQVVKVYVVSKTTPFIVLGDQDGRFFNDFVVKSKINVIDNGSTQVVHGISDVLLPKL
jgi:uncharacterized surface protein with fasciclin (FAS1) repeats